MVFVLGTFFFVLGAIIASFVGVVVGRFGTGESWVSGRSHCDSCGAQLSARDLFPVISWLVSKGHCRSCGSRVSACSTIAEVVLGGLFVISYLHIGMSVGLYVFLVAISFLALIVLYDLRHTLIPGVFSAPFVFLSILFAALNSSDVRSFGIVFLVSAGLALIIFAIHLISRGRAMGLADVPVTFGLALIAGPLAFSGFIYSFWVGAIIGIGILLRTPKGHRMGIEVPFAPFLAAGFLIAFFIGLNVFTFII